MIARAVTPSWRRWSRLVLWIVLLGGLTFLIGHCGLAPRSVLPARMSAHPENKRNTNVAAEESLPPTKISAHPTSDRNVSVVVEEPKVEDRMPQPVDAKSKLEVDQEPIPEEPKEEDVGIRQFVVHFQGDIVALRHCIGVCPRIAHLTGPFS
jgi:hypothetical protein